MGDFLGEIERAAAEATIACGTEIHGVIAIDPYALAALLEFTGPIDVPGYEEPLAAENLRTSSCVSSTRLSRTTTRNAATCWSTPRRSR
jgi:hypothetical protein